MCEFWIQSPSQVIVRPVWSPGSDDLVGKASDYGFRFGPSIFFLAADLNCSSKGKLSWWTVEIQFHPYKKLFIHCTQKVAHSFVLIKKIKAYIMWIFS